MSATAPTLPKDNSFDGFLIADKLPKGITVKDSEVKVELAGETNTDSLIEKEVRDLQEQKLVLVKFKKEDQALGKIAGKNITVTITATVSAVEADSGVKENIGYFYPGFKDTSKPDWDPAKDNDLIKTQPVKSIYGEVTITKQDAHKTDTKLKDAQVELFRCDARGEKTGNRIEINGENTFTTQDNGTVKIKGIHLGNVKENAYEDV